MLARVEEDKHCALCSCISWCSRCLVSENWVAITTRHRLIMKNEPIWMDVEHTNRKLDHMDVELIGLIDMENYCREHELRNQRKIEI